MSDEEFNEAVESEDESFFDDEYYTEYPPTEESYPSEEETSLFSGEAIATPVVVELSYGTIVEMVKSHVDASIQQEEMNVVYHEDMTTPEGEVEDISDMLESKNIPMCKFFVPPYEDTNAQPPYGYNFTQRPTYPACSNPSMMLTPITHGSCPMNGNFSDCELSKADIIEDVRSYVITTSESQQVIVSIGKTRDQDAMHMYGVYTQPNDATYHAFKDSDVTRNIVLPRASLIFIAPPNPDSTEEDYINSCLDAIKELFEDSSIEEILYKSNNFFSNLMELNSQ